MDRSASSRSAVAPAPRRFSAFLTRPAGQSAPLATLLAARHIASIELPLLSIDPIPDTAALDQVWAELARYALLVFVSPNAVLHACARWRALDPDWPRGFTARAPMLAVVGPGSLRALQEQGLGACLTVAPEGAAEELAQDDVSVPRRFDSEALLAALARRVPQGLAAYRATRIALIRGDGGRELLGDALREAGAEVVAVPSYRRGAPRWQPSDWAQVVAALHDGAHAWLISSSEAVRHLAALAPTHLAPADWQRLRQASFIAPHARIAATARACGFDRIRVCGPGDRAIAQAFVDAAQHVEDQE